MSVALLYFKDIGMIAKVLYKFVDVLYAELEDNSKNPRGSLELTQIGN